MQTAYDGLLVIDKPGGITSRDVVNRALGCFPKGTRIGHTGTLDPLATGVLVLCLGVATRLTEYVQRMPKVYAASIQFGASSDSDDADGVITPTTASTTPSAEEVQQALASFVGTIAQVPPALSAVKVTGRRAYDLARKGMEVLLTPRTVTIHAIDVQAYAFPRLDILVRCSKGTYIRALARDLGARLGCGGYIAALRRLEVGVFRTSDALTLPLDADSARDSLQPIARAVAELPRVEVDDGTARRLLQGQYLHAPAGSAEGAAALFGAADRLLAVAEVKDGFIHVSKGMLTPEEV